MPEVVAALLGLVLLVGHRRFAAWLAEGEEDPLSVAFRERFGGSSRRFSLLVGRVWFLLAGLMLLVVAAVLLQRGR